MSRSGIINPNKKIVKLQELRNPERVDGAAVAIPMEAVEEVSSRFSNTLYGYFIGKRLAFPLVENYVKNTWAKFGLKRTQLHEDFFMFQFNTNEGMESVMESGPWLVRGVPLILNIWNQNSELKKDAIKSAPLWVKLHHVPIVAYSEIGLSLITTQLGKPIMLDSYTSNMCLSSWGRNTYARALVEFSAEEELKDSIVIAIPLSNGKGHTLAKIEVEYEWNPPRCNTCKVFDHVNDKCPKNPKVDAPTKAVNDGFTVYRRVDKTDSSRINEKVNNEPINLKTNVPIPKKVNVLNIPTQNSFGALTDDEEKGDMTTILNEDSDCEEVDAEMVFDDRNGQTFTTKGASTPVISENNLSVFAILESKSKLMKMCSLVFRHWDWTSNGAWCSKGTRIILGWNHNEVDVTIINQNDQAVHSPMRDFENALCLNKVFVNYHSWCLLEFHATLHLSESTASSSCIDIAMREFKDCVNNIEVLDVQNTGLQFTWNQKPKGTDGILKKLDRVMANMTFVNDFAGSHAIFKPYRNSDHSPSVLCIPTATKVKPKPFKFFNVLIKHDRFKEVVNEAWNYHRIRGELDTIQTQLDTDPFNIRLREIEAANVVAFNQAVLDEEMFLKQKAKISWLKDGDSNRHTSTIPDAFVAHYEAFLGQTGYTNGFDGSNLFSNCLDEQGAAHMVRMVTDREIKEAMFSMGDEKSPGPDGFSAAFFKEAWHIVGVDVINAIREFFTNGKLLKELNHTIIALIPKVNAPSRINDYRALFRSAFILGRSIADNILLTQELMHNYHLDRGPPRCAFKVDIQKAYDTVDWAFLKSVLMGFGFHERMIAWIMECVSSTSYSICINGNLHGYFQGKRGLRQGDPLSRFFFSIWLWWFLSLCSKIGYMDFGCFLSIGTVFDEFKHASGLIPSIPKSTAFFCNVLNHVKLSILNVLPFEEGRLPVKYLGVPLECLLRLQGGENIVKSCGEVQNRVLDWKNKAFPSEKCGELVCLPKDEGGLGIRRLEHFNSALLVSHIWNLLSLKESLWVKWVHAYKLNGRNFWDVPIRETYIGCITLFLALYSHVGDVIRDGDWVWPRVLLDKYQFLNECTVPLSNNCDTLEWRLYDGTVKRFSVAQVWECIRPRADKVPWVDLIWFAMGIPRHAFNLWLIINHKLKTQDRVSIWDYSNVLGSTCPLCEATPDSHEHLFFICPFANSVWSRMKVKAGLGRVSHNIYDIVDHFGGIARRKTTHVVIAKLVVAASAYFIWQERNWRLFKKSKRSIDQVVSCISSSVRMKLLSCAFKRTTEGVLYARLWDLPNSIFR
ncbi:hypothetical protein Tco_1539686 [Tanacetum coccineum]